MQRDVLFESTKNLMFKGLFEPVAGVPEKGNIKKNPRNILADHYRSHSNFKKRQGHNQQQNICYTT